MKLPAKMILLAESLLKKLCNSGLKGDPYANTERIDDIFDSLNFTNKTLYIMVIYPTVQVLLI